MNAETLKQIRAYSGLPRVDGSDDPVVGLDCAGVARLVYEAFGEELPDGVDLRDLGEFLSGRWFSVRGLEREPLDLILSRAPYFWGHIDVVVNDRVVMTTNLEQVGFRWISDIDPEKIVGEFRWIGGTDGD